MNKHIIFTFLILLSAENLPAESTTLKEIIRSAWNDPEVTVNKTKSKYLNKSRPSTPFIDSVEFRYNSQNLKNNKPRYALRVSPRGWGETKSQNSLFKNKKRYFNNRYDVLLNNNLKIRYQKIIELDYILKQKAVYQKMVLLYTSIIKLYGNQQTNALSAVESIVIAKDNLIDANSKLISLENDEKIILKNLTYLLKKRNVTSLDFSNIITVADIKKQIKNTKYSITDSNIFLKNSHLLVELNKNTLDYEKAKDRAYLSFLEFAYEDDSEFNRKEDFSLKFGIKFPIISDNKEKENSNKLKLLERQHKHKQLQYNLRKEVDTILLKLHGYGKEYSYLTESLKMYNISLSSNEISTTNPLLILKIKKNILKQSLQIEKHRHKIFTNYFNLLELTGNLVRRPFKNHITGKTGK